MLTAIVVIAIVLAIICCVLVATRPKLNLAAAEKTIVAAKNSNRDPSVCAWTVHETAKACGMKNTVMVELKTEKTVQTEASKRAKIEAELAMVRARKADARLAKLEEVEEYLT